MKSTIEYEGGRIKALKKLRILDTPKQACFDRITRHCADIIGCEIALISLVDSNRQWFLSKLGIEGTEAPREISFCNYAIDQGCQILIPDASKDVRFRSNPLTISGPRIRSYLGQPIQSPSGHFIGTLCVADSRPNKFSQDHTTLLQSLGATVEDLISLHEAKIEAEKILSVSVAQTADLRKLNRIFEQAEKVAKIGAWEFDFESETFSGSDEAYKIFQLSKSDKIDIERVVASYASEDRDVVRLNLKNAVDERQEFDFEATLCPQYGSQKRVRVIGGFVAGNCAQPSRLVGLLQDTTETYLSRAAVQRAADYDSLTGVFNRHAFDKFLNENIKRSQEGKKQLTLLMFDLNGFKDVNDTFGHLVGDVVLEETSERLSKAKPKGSILARWGGDEFALILPLDTSADEARQIAETILKRIEKRIEISSHSLELSATCGIARLESRMGAKELVRRADTALYFGKKREPGRVHVYSREVEHSNQVRQEAIAEVRSALSENRLFAGYQPIVDLESREVRGFEALMRLNTRSNRTLTATQVLPAILDPIISRDIGRRMLDFLCQDTAKIKLAYPEFEFVSINSTEGDLLSRGFAAAFLEKLTRNSIEPEGVVLEVTETMLLVNDTQTVRNVLCELKDAGVNIALDDFGTGFSSLSHLRDFPIDKVKIDKSFVQTLAQDHQTRLIVQALIGMARNMDIDVVAEGVETDEQRTLLMQMGCKLGQGFLFSPAEDISRLCLKSFQTKTDDRRQLRAAA
jgi:diguanylate cyclase (GGDEF)-like protein